MYFIMSALLCTCIEWFYVTFIGTIGLQKSDFLTLKTYYNLTDEVKILLLYVISVANDKSHLSWWFNVHMPVLNVIMRCSNKWLYISLLFSFSVKVLQNCTGLFTFLVYNFLSH